MTWTAAISAFFGALLGGLAKQLFALISARASRKLALINSLEEQLMSATKELREYCVNYWTEDSSEKDRMAIPVIFGNLELIKWLYPKLFEKNLEVKRRVDVAFHRMRRSITGGDFGGAERQADQDRSIEIETEAAKFASTLLIERSNVPVPFV